MGPWIQRLKLSGIVATLRSYGFRPDGGARKDNWVTEYDPGGLYERPVYQPTAQVKPGKPDFPRNDRSNLAQAAAIRPFESTRAKAGRYSSKMPFDTYSSYGKCFNIHTFNEYINIC